MGVSADLCDQSAGGQSGQISGHKRDISPKKTEGRGGHAPNLDRNESGDPTAIGSYDQFNRIKAANRGRVPRLVPVKGEAAMHPILTGTSLGPRPRLAHMINSIASKPPPLPIHSS